MSFSDYVAKAAYGFAVSFLPLLGLGTVSFDLYDKGLNSPFVSLVSAFLGLYLGFMIVWKALVWLDEGMEPIMNLTKKVSDWSRLQLQSMRGRIRGSAAAVAA